MKTIAILIHSVLILSVLAAAEPQIGRLENLSDSQLKTLRSMDVRIFHDEVPGITDVVVDEWQISVLQSAGYYLADLKPWSLAGLDEIDPEYHTYEEYTETLEQYAGDYPSLCKLDSIGHAQQFPRTIWSMKISDNPAVEEDELAILYIGVHHACEVMGGETLLYMIGHLLENYGTDPEITAWIDDYEIFFVPLLNPDGNFAVTEGISYFWRKNARDIDGDSIYYEFTGGTWWSDDTEGIDLNRNYDWFWDTGGTSNPWSYYYRGESAFSESETQALRDLALEQHFVTGISFHSYGEVIIYPWDYAGQPCPDQDVYDDYAGELASRFLDDNGQGYDLGIWEAESGQCRNWFYGTQGAFNFCVELLEYPTFIPPGDELEWRTELYYDGAKYLLQRAGLSGVTGNITDALTGEPVHARVEIAGRISDQVDPRYNEPLFGRYTRLLNPGDYDIVVLADGYDTTFVPVTIADVMLTENILLEPLNSVSAETLPDNYQLTLDCSPNPFNASLQISYSVSRPGLVNLTVYDILGRHAADLAGGKLETGNHSVTWDAGNINSGIYFIRLETPTGTVTRKVALIK